MIRKLSYILIAVTVALSGLPVAVSAAPDDDVVDETVYDFYSDNDITFYNADAPEPCIPGQSMETGQTTIGPEIEVGATIFGGTWDGSELKRDSSDDNGEGKLGPHAGHTMFAELSSPGSNDFAQLAKLLDPPEEYLGWTSGDGKEGFKAGTKFKVTYKGKSIIMEKRDVGGGGGPIKNTPRAIDLWYETAKLLDFREGTAVMKIQQVVSNTPVTPLDGKAVSNSTNADAPLSTPSGGSMVERVFSFLLGKGLSRNQALGVVGNLIGETGSKGSLELKPTALNSIGAFGIVQWIGPRLSGLEDLAKKNGTTRDDFSTQVNHMWNELNTTYRDSTLTPLMASSTVEESVRIVLEKYEIPCVPGKSGKGCDTFYEDRLEFAKTAEQQLSGVSGGATSSVTTCEDGQSSTTSSDTAPGSVNADGYAIPLKNYKAPERLLRCGPKTCHHDGTPAFDLIVPAGTSVVAITDGTISSNKPYNVGTASQDSQCRSIQFKGDDGWIYWYGHTYVNHSVGKRFKAGEVMGVIGSKNCGLGGTAHLHIDRGSPKGRNGGTDAHRDADFISLMRQIFITNKGV